MKARNRLRDKMEKKDMNPSKKVQSFAISSFFKVHISFAITMAVEGFYPKSSAGFTEDSFTSLNQALPMMTLIISMTASSFGMTKFFLKGPISILQKDSPMNGLLSISFIATLFSDTMFGCRVVCIENSFFSSYRYQRYEDGTGLHQKTIDPIIQPEYRLIAYFVPSFISFIFNAGRMFKTCTNLTGQIRKHPQIMVASCFTPFMFEGTKENTVRIWKLGSFLNAVYIGCLPPIVLIIMDYYRDIVNWDFLGNSLRNEGIYENNDALFKSRWGNTLFAIISGTFFSFLIILTFCTDKILRKNGCIERMTYIASSPTNIPDPTMTNDQIGPQFNQLNCNERLEKVRIFSSNQIDRIAKLNRTSLKRKKSRSLEMNEMVSFEHNISSFSFHICHLF